MRPADLPSGERWPHGTRSRYVGAKCRCDRCREANRLYYHQRKALADAAALELRATPLAHAASCPGVNGVPCPRGSRVDRRSKGGVCEVCRRALVSGALVDVAPVRAHLEQLSRAGVGYKSAAEAASVARSTVGDVLFRGQKKMRADLAKRLLEVTAAAVADAAIVDARPTWRLIRKLLAAGVTKAAIARALGNKVPALQLNRSRVLARNAHAVEVFARRELAILKLMKRRCPLCGHTHEDDREAAVYCADRLAGIPERDVA